jgi:hypothetical protein
MFGKDDTNQQLAGLVDEPFVAPSATAVSDDLATALADESGNLPTPAFTQTATATSLPQVQTPEPTTASPAVSDTTSVDVSELANASIIMPTEQNQPEKMSAVAAPFNANNLLDIKQKVLEQLSPIVNHLDQTPEERFRTTMMMIQATDNQTLIKDAYDAALKISDEKIKAQALLDVVNEINYFTQQASQNTTPAKS